MANNSSFFDDILKMTDSETQNAFNAIRVQCPTKKINLKETHPVYAAGLYTLTLADSDEYIKNLAKKNMDDVEDDTLILMPMQFMIECMHFLNGMWRIVEDRHGITEAKRRKGLKRFLQAWSDIPEWYYYQRYCDKAASVFEASKLLDGFAPDDSDEGKIIGEEYSKEVYRRICEITKYLPFLTYNDFDQLARAAIKKYEEGNNNEKSDTSSS